MASWNKEIIKAVLFKDSAPAAIYIAKFANPYAAILAALLIYIVERGSEHEITVFYHLSISLIAFNLIPLLVLGFICDTSKERTWKFSLWVRLIVFLSAFPPGVVAICIVLFNYSLYAGSAFTVGLCIGSAVLIYTLILNAKAEYSKDRKITE